MSNITLNINQSNRLTEFNKKLNTIIFLSSEDRNHIQSSLTLSYDIKATYKSNTIHLRVIKRSGKMKQHVIHRIITKLFTLIELFTNNQNTILIYTFGYLI